MNTTLTSETRLSVRTDLLATTLSEKELVMMNMDKGKYYGMEDTGKVIWDFLEQSRTVGEVCAEVCKQFEIEPEVAEKDTIDFLNHLVEEGLVVVQEKPLAS